MHRSTSCALNGHSHRLTIANQMLSLIGSVQPDPFSPEHVPRTKPERAQSHQPSPRSVPEPVESEATDYDERDAHAARPSPDPASDGDERRKVKEGKEETLATIERKRDKKSKRKRKEEKDVAKSEHKPKRKRTS